MRSLPRLLAVATLLAASALTTPAFAAGIDADLAAAENSYAALDFPNAVSLAEDLNFFKLQGLVQNDVSVARATDTSYQEAALKKLGPYHPRRA